MVYKFVLQLQWGKSLSCIQVISFSPEQIFSYILVFPRLNTNTNRIRITSSSYALLCSCKYPEDIAFAILLSSPHIHNEIFVQSGSTANPKHTAIPFVRQSATPNMKMQGTNGILDISNKLRTACRQTELRSDFFVGVIT